MSMDLFTVGSLIGSIGVLIYGLRCYNNAVDLKKDIERKIYQANAEFNTANQKLQSKKQEIELFEQKTQEERRAVEDFIAAKISQYPVIAKMLADYHAARDEAIAASLIHKKRPALTAAERVRNLKEEKEELRTKLLSCSWELEAIYSILPEFREIHNVSIENAISSLQAICMNITLQEARETAKRKVQAADAILQEAHENAQRKMKEAETYYNEQQMEIEKNSQQTTQLADKYYDDKTREAKAYYNEWIQNADAYYDKKIAATMNECQIKLQATEDEIQKKNQEAIFFVQKYTQEQENIINGLLKENVSKFPVITLAIADYRAEKEALELRLADQRRPAPKATEQVKQLSKEKRELLAENLAYKYELNYLHSLLPWLEDLEDEPMEAIQENDEVNPYSQNDDAASRWLSPEEYRSLPTVEKYQLALDNYMKRNKSNAEIGRDYERYIGYQYELEGYKVTYYGAENGLEDLGRDLICTKGQTVLIVQCKCWSNKKKKIIHEKHINQLYGTTIKYYIDHFNQEAHTPSPDDGLISLFPELKRHKIIPVFVSTVPYSDTALKFANALGVQCRNIELGIYPMIKCNISHRDGEKIYHLPFDQQYDKCIIEKEEGEFYALTVQEAENAGFRRAMRWRGK